MNNDRRIARGGSVPTSYRHPLIAYITFFLGCLRDVPDPAAERRVRWTPQAAGTASVLMALNHHIPLRAACGDALSCMSADFRRQHRVGRTYNGLAKALERQANEILPLVKSSLRRHVRKRLRRIPDTAGWTLLAVDGSKEELPRTRDHERVFGIADNGVVPQALVTAITEVRTGLPWDWRIDRGRAAEKEHLIQMATALPKEALLLADSNFVGYPIWSQLNRLNKSFLIRVGGNVHLIAKLWPELHVRVEDRTVYAWPKTCQRTAGPLKLRLIRVGRGKKAVYLLTNVLESTRLTKKAAGEIYRLRWGVELFYRTMKRTFDYAKLRSKASRRARIEMEWALVTMTITTLIGIDVLTRRRLNPARLSPAQLLETLRTSLHRPATKTSRTALSQLRRNVAAGLKDTYQRRRSKKSRVRRHTKTTPTTHLLKPPLIRDATPNECRIARKIAINHAA